MRTKSQWFRKTVVTLLLLSPLWIAGLLAWIFVSGGDLYDRFDVISSSASPDGRTVAVLYQYDYAELSMKGFSVWIQSADQPVEGSRSGWPKGDAAFTTVNMEQPISFKWVSDGDIEVSAGRSAIIRWTKGPDGCFWENGTETESIVLCLHTGSVSARIEN